MYKKPNFYPYKLVLDLTHNCKVLKSCVLCVMSELDYSTTLANWYRWDGCV